MLKLDGSSVFLWYVGITSVKNCDNSLSKPHLSGSACVMLMRGREVIGKLVGLVRVTVFSSGVSGLPLSLSFSACRHDNGGSCRLPEKRLWTLHTSTPSVLPVGNCSTESSLLSWNKKRQKKQNKKTLHYPSAQLAHNIPHLMIFTPKRFF